MEALDKGNFPTFLHLLENSSLVSNVLLTLLPDKNGTIEWSEFRNFFNDQSKGGSLSLFLNLNLLQQLSLKGELFKVSGDAAKWTNRLGKKWQKRFCVLHAEYGLFSYFRDQASAEDNSKPSGVIPLFDYAEVREAQHRKGMVSWI